MLDYGRGMGGYPNEFAAMPKIVQGKPKYKDPYSQSMSNEEYYPQNIMFDRRVARGSTFAAMVIPAGTNPDAMITDKAAGEKPKRSFKKKSYGNLS